ncbi:MAG: hypothetical protein R2737_10760 [Candidatus Nanopelagicales bacterium]
MPTFILTDWQVATLLAIGGVPEPRTGSPLRVVRAFPRPIAPGEPGWDLLERSGLVRPAGTGWRVSLPVRSVLFACAQPDEVIDLGVNDPTIPGFTICRRDNVVAECTVIADGTTRLSFPLTRTAAILTLVSGLSGDRSEPEPSGFRFRGTAAEAFVLASALRRLREDPTPMTLADLRSAVARDSHIAGYAMPFAIAAGPDAVLALVQDRHTVDAAISSLVQGGYLDLDLDTVRPSAIVEAALTGDATAVLGVGRTEYADGRAAHASMTATRVGDRTLAFRVITPTGQEPLFEWSEVDRATLRWLVLGMLLTREELELLESSGEGPAPAAAAAAPERVTPPEPEPAQPVAPAPPAPVEPVAQTPPEPVSDAPPVWTPTHAAPAAGLWAFAEPDPQGQPVATLDPGLPVAVDREWGPWSHIVCENGWQAWVDGSALVPLP